MAQASPTGATGRRSGVVAVGLATGPHVRLLGGTAGVVHAVAPGAVEAHPVGSISRCELGLGAVEEARDGLCPGAVSAEQAMIPELPKIAGLRAGCPPRFLERLVELAALPVLALLADFKLSEQVSDLVLTEAGEREIDVGRRLKVREQPGQELLVPGARDLVQGEPEEASLLDGDVGPGHGDAREPEPPRSNETLVAADDGPIISPGEDRLDEPGLAQAPR